MSSSSSPIRSRKSRVIGFLTSSHNHHAPSNNHLDCNDDIPSLMIPNISPNSQGSIISQSSTSGSPSKRKRQKSCNNILRHLLYKIKTSRLLLISILILIYSLGSTIFLMTRMDYISIDNRGLRMFNHIRESSTRISKHIKRRRYPQVIQYNDIHELLTSSIIMYMDTKERLESISSDDRDKRTIYMSKKELKEQKRLSDSDDFSYRDPLYEGECVPMQPWQETSFPNCNLVSLFCLPFTCIRTISFTCILCII